MAIEKKLICFARLAEFERQLAAGNILDYSIVFIQDAKKIWNRGTYYDCSTLTESDIAAMGFTKNTGTYSKPSGGIPKRDLASAVQTSLGKADTAIQSTSFGELTDLALVKGFESAQKGTVYALPDEANGDEDDILLSRSSVKTVNGQSIVGSGDITIQGGGSYDDSEIREAISQLSAITNDFNSDIANLYNVKQDTLESGTNIKTINGQSILGSGNVSISGGNGTITGVSANGTSIATSGVANIPAASTSAYGVTKLSSATNSTSTTLAATASAVKAAYDLASGKASMSDVNTAIANAITTTLNTAV